MYTDVSIINASSIISNDKIIFFQKIIPYQNFDIKPFTAVEHCSYRWSHTFRMHWKLSFRLVYKSGMITSQHHLKTIYTDQRKHFLIFKEGIISIQQSYKGGKQVIEFKQIKGNGFITVQIFKGDFMINEQPFREKYLVCKIDTIISVAMFKGLKLDNNKNVLNIDYTNVKAIDIILKGDQNTHNKLYIDTITNWF